MSAHLLNARVVKHFFYNAPALNALPVHLLRQVFFLGLLGVFFLGVFSVRFLGVPEGSFGAHGALWGSFGGRLGVILVTFWG